MEKRVLPEGLAPIGRDGATSATAYWEWQSLGDGKWLVTEPKWSIPDNQSER